jgi:CPA1 family monovalent cation:H+ antiporter
MTTVLSGESLINDAAALTFYKVALAGVLGAGGSLLGVDWSSAAETFGLAVERGWESAWLSAGWCTPSGCGCTTRWWSRCSA